MSDDHRGKILHIPTPEPVAYVEASAGEHRQPIRWRLISRCRWNMVVDARRYFDHATIRPQLEIIPPVSEWTSNHRNNLERKFSNETVEALEIRVQPTEPFASLFRPQRPRVFPQPRSITRTFLEGRNRTRYAVEAIEAAELVVCVPSTREVYDDRMPIAEWSEELTAEYDRFVEIELQKYDFFIRFAAPQYL